MGLFSELRLAVPWGHIAVKVWGSQKNPPVLCLHAWLENANSFDRLIPLLPQDFHYVAMDFGGHGLSSHYSPGLPYYHHNFVSEVRRVAAAFKWTRFSLLGHSFGGTVGGMFACIFPEMVDQLILLDSTPFFLDSNETENILTYKRRNMEHMFQVEASQNSLRVSSLEEMLQGWVLPARAGHRRAGTGVPWMKPSKIRKMHRFSAQPLPPQNVFLPNTLLCFPLGGTQHQASESPLL
ncbi:serine hydrolase-like protein isoform X1 [Cricetulus griseus]|uniref:serine hydrolase-like protein isoform X1 n=1 Tax=Cricetulus griseus TaxID=10029 RepID=UPI0007DA4CE1|nr:serine hydrolase-like protein isoform X1 [Cricetulus griseus]